MFTFRNVELTAGSQELITPVTTKPACRKYLPFNFITISNQTSAELLVYINQNPTEFIEVAGNTIVIADKGTYPAIRTLIIKNNDATATILANKVTIKLQRSQADLTSLSEPMVKSLVKLGLFG